MSGRKELNAWRASNALQVFVIDGTDDNGGIWFPISAPFDCRVVIACCIVSLSPPQTQKAITD
mgnify:CR=1 FL=1